MQEDSKKWYVIRITYQRELKAKQFLDERGIDNFLPMQYAEEIKSGKKCRKLVPAIHNLIFVNASEKEIKSLKTEAEINKVPFRYMIDKSINKPMIVNDKEMRNFIAVAGTYNEQLIYFVEGEEGYPILRSSDKVRVTGGSFAGVEGYIVKIKKDRRILVSIKGMFAVVSAFIHPDLLEKI